MSTVSSTAPGAGERERLRAEHKVRLITEQEEGSDLLRLPNGVYGFTYAPASQEIPVFMKQPLHSFEVHRGGDGSFFLLGCVKPAEAGKAEGEVDIYPDAYGDATTLMSIPYARVVQMKGPSRSDGNAVRVKLTS